MGKLANVMLLLVELTVLAAFTIAFLYAMMLLWLTAGDF